MIYGVFDTSSRNLRFCQAGHPGPVLLSAGGELQPLGSGGFPVGLMPDMEYEEDAVTLRKGDRLILYSDGIPECVDQQGERYTNENLFSVLRRNAAMAVSDLVQSVGEDIVRWRANAELSDDVSLLALETR
jgi:sigma-B regulation protein RsbU (phosphoserine phosphatase)